MANFMKKASSFFGMSDVPEDDEDFPMDNEADSQETLLDTPSLALSHNLNVEDEVDDTPGFGAKLTRIISLHPKSYEDAQKIGRAIRSDISVILNLGSVNNATGTRILDFCCGLIYGLKGSIERIDNHVFVLTPKNVKLQEDKSQLVDNTSDLFS